MKYLILLISFILIGCTDANIKQFTTLGSKAHVTCYSGKMITYEGDSSGKVAAEKQSDGWYFEDDKTGQLIRVSGACVIRN